MSYIILITKIRKKKAQLVYVNQAKNCWDLSTQASVTLVIILGSEKPVVITRGVTYINYSQLKITK